MDKEHSIKLNNQILTYLYKQASAVTISKLLVDLNLRSFPKAPLGSALNELQHKGYLLINSISGGRHVYKLTDEGREFVREGGYRGQLLSKSSPEAKPSETKEGKLVEKKRIFISYSHANYRKVELIKTALLKHPLFDPYVVADKRRPNDALVKLVKEGIDGSYCVIPILSPQSYKEQWINQEIGYALGVGRKVAPIIGDTILDKLKGFVHKQNQCPYIYKSNKGISMSGENKGFMQKFRLLIKDLEEEIAAERNKDKEVIEKANQSFNGRPSTKIVASYKVM